MGNSASSPKSSKQSRKRFLREKAHAIEDLSKDFADPREFLND
jgi:hypothetical protein